MIASSVLLQLQVLRLAFLLNFIFNRLSFQRHSNAETPMCGRGLVVDHTTCVQPNPNLARLLQPRPVFAYASQ